MIRFDVPVRARTVASSANLGPGFDALGLALGLTDEVQAVAVRPASDQPSAVVVVRGEGAGSVPTDESHLVVLSLRAGLARAAERAGCLVPDVALRLECQNTIPHGRGLGSSAAAISVGLILARGLLEDPSLLDDQTVFDLANAAEGHPDNASAALFGGCTLSWTERHGGDLSQHAATAAGAGAGSPLAAGPHCPGHARTVQLELHPDLQAVVCVPELELATSRARAMLPELVPHSDAVFTVGRAALLTQALTQRPELLLAATEDRLHQAQRAPAMPDTAALVRAVRERGGAAVVSGAGPSVLVLGADAALGEQVTAALEIAAERARADRRPAVSWRVLQVPVDREGTRLVAR